MLSETVTSEFLGKLEILKIRSRRSFLGKRQGSHTSLKRGFGIEFADYRQYETGDDIRHIDWGVYGRTDRLYIKRFREEEDITVLLMIDTSSSMSVPSAEFKWNKARDAVLSLSYVALMKQDSVVIYPFGDKRPLKYFGGRSIHQLSKDLLGVKIGGDYSFSKEALTAVSRVRFPGVAVVLSDFLMPLNEIERGFNILRAKNLDIMAIQILSNDDLDPLSGLSSAIAVDSENRFEMELELTADTRKMYANLLDTHNYWLREYFASSGVSYVLTTHTESLYDLMLTTLPKTGLLQ